MNKNIKFEKAKKIQEFANKCHNGNYTKAVNDLCDIGLLALEKKTKGETK